MTPLDLPGEVHVLRFIDNSCRRVSSGSPGLPCYGFIFRPATMDRRTNESENAPHQTGLLGCKAALLDVSPCVVLWKALATVSHFDGCFRGGNNPQEINIRITCLCQLCPSGGSLHKCVELSPLHGFQVLQEPDFPALI